MIRSIGLVGIFSLIVACDGGSSKNNSATDVELEDLVGVWQSIKVGDEDNEIYSVIKEDGSFIDYDYQADSVDNGDNCYEKSEQTISFVSKGKFKLSIVDQPIEAIIQFEKNDGGFDLTFLEIIGIEEDLPDGVSHKLRESDLQESSFENLCDAE